MKTISTKLDDATVQVLEEKAQQQNMTVSEYLRQQIYPLIEGTRNLSLEQCLAKLESCLSRLHFCVKPLQELAFDLQKLDVAFSLGLKEKKANEQSQIEPQTVTTPS